MFRSLAFVLGLAASLTAQCSSAACFGPPGTDPVVISGAWQIASGANLDFGTRHVIVSTTGTLVLNGPCTIGAAKLTMQAGSLIDGTAVPLSDLTITTNPGGPHDGSASLMGMINLSGWPQGSQFGQNAGSFMLSAGGPATVQALDTTGGFSAIAGSVTVNAPSITIGTIIANVTDFFSTAALISLFSTGPVSVGSIDAMTSTGSTPSQVLISCSSYTQTGGIVAAPYDGSGANTPACLISIGATTGTAVLNGQVRTGGLGIPHGGAISVHAPQGVTWTNALGSVSGDRGGALFVTSQLGSIAIVGSLLARTEADADTAGVVFISAASQIDFTGLLDVRASQSMALQQPIGSLQAGGQLTIHSGSTVDLRDLSGGCQTIGGQLVLEACRIVIESGASAVTCGHDPIEGATANILVRDKLVNDGVILGGPPPGGVFVNTRLPWSTANAGSGTIVPPPAVTVNPDFLPCTDTVTAVHAAPSAVNPGQTLTLTVNSVPNKPLLVAASTAVTHLSLGPYGWTQVDVFNSWLIADQEAILGPIVPGATNASGVWTWSVTVPQTPILSNVDVYFDVYVIDPAAPNGLFRQPPFASTHVN
jgi:hypothetical protein